MEYKALYTRGRPKNFSQLAGQGHIVKALIGAISANRLSHAYLLVGTRGTGKTSTARLLAKAMNCEKVLDAQKNGTTLDSKDVPCNECASCKSIDSSPDNVEFDAASNRSVEDITRLLSTAYLAPLQSKVKTFIIDEVHMLSNEAINSILKLIEEPPPNVAFFLATTELNKVPMTIRSRCQVLNFKLIAQETISKYLMSSAEKLKIPFEEEAIKKIARIAAGSMRDAMTYLDQCYSMNNGKIALKDVNEILGLVSDSVLDEIISAVNSQDRIKVDKAIQQAFSSGVSPISIAESLITRLRDLEFEKLEDHNSYDFLNSDSLISEIRKAIFEMQSSTIPDVILEMTLLKFATPQIVSEWQVSDFDESAQVSDFDKSAKVSQDIEEILDSAPQSLTSILKFARVEDFSNNTLKLCFGKGYMQIFTKDVQTQLEIFLKEQLNNNNISVEAFEEVEKSKNDLFNSPKFANVEETDRPFLLETMNIFGAKSFKKIIKE